MAGDEQARHLVADRRSHSGRCRKGGVDAAVAGDVDSAANPLPAEVGGTELRRGEQQFSVSVDGHPELLLRPRAAEVVASKPRLDMGDRNRRRFSGKRAAERARGVALDHQQLRPIRAKQVGDRPAHHGRMGVRVLLAGAAEAHGAPAAKAVIRRLELRVLAREDQRRRDAEPPKRLHDGSELDGFGAGADDDSNATGQPSP